MKITLEVLQKNGADTYALKSFLEYCIEKNQNEFNPVDIILQEPCFFHSDIVRPIIYGCIDDIEELRFLVDHYIKKEKGGIYDVFKYCGKCFKYDLNLFRRAVWYVMTINQYNSDIEAILEHCGEILELMPDVRINLKQYHEAKEKLRCLLS